MGRWIWRGLLGVLALFVVGVVVVVIALHTSWGRNQIRVRAERTIAEYVPGGNVHIGSVEGSVFGTLVANDLEIDDHEGRPIVRVKKIDIDLSLLPLLGGTARVDALVFDDVDVSVHPTATPAPVLPPVEPSSLNIELPFVHATDVRVAIETPGETPVETITLEDVEVTGAATLPAQGTSLATVRVRGTWTERGVPVHLHAGVRIGDSVQIPFAHAGVGGVVVTASRIDLEGRDGQVFVVADAANVAQLVPGVALPGDVVVALDGATDAGVTKLAVRGRVDGVRIDGALQGTLDEQRGAGVLAGTDVDVGAISGDRVRGRGTAVLAFAVDGPRRARGAIFATGAIEDAPGGAIVLGFEATRTRADVFALAGADGATRLSAVGTLARDGERIELVHGAVVASTQDPGAASAGRVALRGSVAVTASARGALDALAVTGRVTGRRLRYEDLGAGSVEGTFRATLAATFVGSAHLEATAITQRGELLGSGTIDARTLGGNRFAVSAHAQPAAVPVVVDADAVVTAGDVIAVALGSHRVQTPASTWAGQGGTIRIAERDITVRGLASESRRGRVAIEATIGRTSPMLAASIDARDIPASVIDPAYRGCLKGVVAIERHGDRWTGGGALSGVGLAIGPGQRAVDGEVALMIEGRRVMLSGKATSAELGGVRVALEVDGPRDLLDVAAWRRVPDRDLHAIVLGFDALQPRFVTDDRIPGVYDGTLEIRDGTPSGVIHVRAIATRLGPARGDVTLAITEDGYVDINAKATVGVIGMAEVGARVQVPEYPFDRAAWQSLGKHVIAGGSVRSKNLPIDQRVLAELGLDLPYRARANVDVVVGSGAETADVQVELLDIRGGQLRSGIDLSLSAWADAGGTMAEVRATSGTSTLVETQGVRTPVTLAQWITDPQRALAAPLAGRLEIPQQSVVSLLAMVNRHEVRRGTVTGTATVAGTVGRPTGALTVELRDVDVTPRVSRRPLPTLEQLRVVAGWDGSSASLEVTGREAGKGTLAITASGRPSDLASIVASLTIDDFEIAPVAVFLPGVFSGASGLVDANLEIRGLAPATAHVRGRLALVDARMPVASTIGTLRDANVHIEIKDSGITARLDGKIGSGKITARASSTANGLQTTFTAKLTEVSPIGVLQPKITADVSGKLRRRSGLQFVGDVGITNATVRVPAEEGTALLDAEAPSDLYFVDSPLPARADGPKPPVRPWLVVDVTLAPARIEAPRFSVVSTLLATAEGRVRVSVGETVGMDGSIQVTRANADLFGHRYRLDEGEVVFDGTPDARFDLQLSTDLRDITMNVRLAGRLSELDTLEPQLSSEPALYSQSQLLGFFLGGSPSSDPNESARDTVVSAGSSIASQRIARWIERGLGPVLPLRLDVASCVPRLSDNAVVCTFGKWATKNVFVWYDYQSERRHGDNSGSARIEWHFRPRWTLETAVDLDYAGADLTWRKRW
ncbi:MAG: translocation/assembly module TamB domain-containing protein [Kofleriaceae bacterium]|nr:translocation/assembly module TamB domain-containing protein [Kofleriaceae bacterium]